MNHYAPKQEKATLQSVAHNTSPDRDSNRAMAGFIDNRPASIAQRKLQQSISNRPSVMQNKFIQFRSSKEVTLSGQKHYNDGWGERYDIQSDDELKEKVPNSVKGDGEIGLGIYEFGTRWEYKGDEYKKGKRCSIAYSEKDQGVGKYKSKLTSIYHCGPSGGSITVKV